MRELFLGVDAGNTKSIAAVMDATGALLGWARGGLGDIYGVDVAEDAVDEILRLVDLALAEARASHPLFATTPLRAAAFRLAGVDWPEDADLWNAALQDHLGAETPVTVKNDGFALLRCGDPDGVGVAASIGTGAAFSARSRTGAEFAMSWWLQHPLGAAGLVDDALRAVFQAHVGMAPETELSHSLPAFYEAASVEELLHSFTRRVNPRRSHLHKSTAARTVLRMAQLGDPVAASIVEIHAVRIVDYVTASARRVGIDTNLPFTVTLGGSVISNDNPLRRATLAAFGSGVPAATVTTSPASPIRGCVLDALAEGGVDLNTTIRGAVESARLDEGTSAS